MGANAINPTPSSVEAAPAAGAKPTASIAVSYPRPDDERGTAESVVTVPAGTYRPDQPAIQLKASGEGPDFSVTTVQADGTERTPNPSELLVVRDQLFKAFEDKSLSPIQKGQVERALNMCSYLFSQSTPNHDAYTGSVLGGVRPCPAEVGLPRGTIELRVEDNVYLKANKPPTLYDPIEVQFNNAMKRMREQNR